MRPKILRRIELGPTAARRHRGSAGLAGEEATGARCGAQGCVVDHHAAAAQHRYRPASDDTAFIGGIAGEIVRQGRADQVSAKTLSPSPRAWRIRATPSADETWKIMIG